MNNFKYKPAFESRFKKNYKKMIKGGRYKKTDFEIVYYKLLSDQTLDVRYNDHQLTNRKPERDLHIKPDWLLIYKYNGQYIKFIDTGTHADLF